MAMETEITPIAFSKGTKERAKSLTNKAPEMWLILSPEVFEIVQAIENSGFCLKMANDLGAFMANTNNVLGTERKTQDTLINAGITDDTTANQWLAQIEPKLLTARSEYQKLSDRHKQELEEFCKQWRV
jgi:hypothetical protein